MSRIHWLVIDIVISLALASLFGVWFLTSHAWGAWGDDAPGYMYTAGTFLHRQDLVTKDILVKQGLDYFGNEKLARWLAPTHYEIIAPTGWVASRYPIGLGWLMAAVATIGQSDELIYLVVPTSAMLVVVLCYVLGIMLLPGSPIVQRLGAVFAAMTVGVSNVFANYAVAEPMREIPSLVFILLAYILVLVVTRQQAKPPARWQAITVLVLAGAAYGMSINVRETSAILLPSVLILLFYGVAKANWKQRGRWLGWFMLGVVVTGSLSIWNSVLITQHKEKFRDKDITSIAITSNIDHIQSLSLTNLYNNQGKFKPGVGGLNQYWQILQGFSNWPVALVFAVIGAFLLWRQDKRLGWWWLSWFGSILLLFAAWINPYPRYIIPLFPAVGLALAYGMISGMSYLIKHWQLGRVSTAVLIGLVVVSSALSLQPAIAERLDLIQQQQPVYKAITQADLTELKRVASTIKPIADKPALLLMMGDWQPGISETIMTHSNVHVIRFPHKPNELPPVNDLISFVQTLPKTYQLYVWYDVTANANEQKLLKVLTKTDVTIAQFSFQDNVTIYQVN